MGRTFQTVLMMEQNTHGRRPHHHRGRRGQDRRGSDRRVPPAQQQPQEQGGRDQRDHVDIDQVMREIRARIDKGSGIDLTNQQIQELAAQRLEAILDPRTVKPALLDQLRRGAAAPAESPAAAVTTLNVEEHALYDSANGFIRFMRRLLRPLLALFIDPAPLVAALKTQSTVNEEAQAREAARDRRQTEWNALQFDLLQRMVTETARVSIEMQSLALQVESLAAKVDFNERRVRGMENTAHQTRPAGRSHEPVSPPQVSVPRDLAAVPTAIPAPDATAVQQPTGGELAGDGTRRRRRRRRGRRSGSGQQGAGFSAVAGGVAETTAADQDTADGDDVDLDIDEPGDDGPPIVVAPEVTVSPVAIDQPIEQQTADPEPIVVAPEPVVVPPEPVVAVQPEPIRDQPTPPRDEAVVTPAETPPPVEPADPGPSDR
jgi:hypothetical protein